jgi:rhamnogalacturonan endolyase
MKVRTICLHGAMLAGILMATSPLRAQHVMERLGRGVVAVRTGTTAVYVGWRLLGTDPDDIAFNVYRSIDGGAPAKLNAEPVTSATNYVDAAADPMAATSYFVRPVVAGLEQATSAVFTIPALAPVQQYISIPLQIPAGGVTPDGVSYVYSANDASIGDLDGDGEYEIVLKWDPSNAKDNSQSGFTGNGYLDAYKVDGTRLWRIDLGRNIRAGAHYTQVIVYDLDSDGRAEVACRTADGTVDGAGHVLGDPSRDYRNAAGYVLAGPEFLTIFDGLTGAALTTTDYIPARGEVCDWGDCYGNRVDRFLAGIAYLDGHRPSLIMARGYYTRTVIVAWDWGNAQLTPRWTFDSRDGTPGNTTYEGQGNHQLSVADVDGDGKDEIIYGAMSVDDDGKGLYTTRLGHGDALHVTDMDPDRPGVEVFQPHECPPCYGPNGLEFRDARSGELIWGVTATRDVGRGLALDIDPRYRGYEMWGAADTGGMYSAQLSTPDETRGPRGVQISASKPSINFGVWWDADLLRELLDNVTISKWNWTTGTLSTLLAPDGVASNNGTKATPTLSGDIFGDWREEVIWRTSDNTALRIYTTTIPAANRFYTLMHDRQYREAIAWQNVAYNQPPHPGFFFGDGMSAPPRPDILYEPDTTPPALRLPADQIVEATGPDGAVVTFSGSAHDNLDGFVPITFEPLPGSRFPRGTTTVKAVAIDTWGNTASGSFTVTVHDTTAPAFQRLVASRGLLWPPNHRMVPVAVSAVVTDAVDPSPATRIVMITSNEPTAGIDAEDLAPDWEITGPLAVNLRAERASEGSGRTYTITVESRDSSGNASRRTLQVVVPHNR